ncbi:hypothetical protein D3C76_908300 [compost metagenome]
MRRVYAGLANVEDAARIDSIDKQQMVPEETLLPRNCAGSVLCYRGSFASMFLNIFQFRLM